MSVHYEQRDDVALLTLDRPDLFNAINQSLVDGLIDGLKRAGDEARCAVITGRGRAFCSGADLTGLADAYESGSPDLSGLIEERYEPMLSALVDASVPTIAAVNGPTAGAGLGIALATDLRVMSPEAFLNSAFVGIGLIPDTGTTWWLAHHVGVSRAIEFVIGNRRLGADEARELGLVHRVADDVVNEAVTWGNELADGAIGAMVESRKLLHGAAGGGLTAALAAERVSQGRLGASPAHHEGVAAFREKRPPDYRSV